MEILIGLLGVVFAAVLLVDVRMLRRRAADGDGFAPPDEDVEDDPYLVLHLPGGR